jgi:hypothetical protein
VVRVPRVARDRARPELLHHHLLCAVAPLRSSPLQRKR